MKFLAAIELIRQFIFKRHTILKGWKDTDLFPPKPDILHANIDHKSAVIVEELSILPPLQTPSYTPLPTPIPTPQRT